MEQLSEFERLPAHIRQWPGGGGRHQRAINWHYWNAMDLGIYIVAAVNAVDGVPFDWAAYIGANQEGCQDEHDGYQDVLDHGAKIGPDLANAAFPEYAHIPYRR